MRAAVTVSYLSCHHSIILGAMLIQAREVRRSPHYTHEPVDGRGTHLGIVPEVDTALSLLPRLAASRPRSRHGPDLTPSHTTRSVFDYKNAGRMGSVPGWEIARATERCATGAQIDSFFLPPAPLATHSAPPPPHTGPDRLHSPHTTVGRVAPDTRLLALVHRYFDVSTIVVY